MNLERGETFYYRLLQLDMFGIWMSQSVGELMAFINFIQLVRQSVNNNNNRDYPKSTVLRGKVLYFMGESRVGEELLGDLR